MNIKNNTIICFVAIFTTSLSVQSQIKRETSGSSSIPQYLKMIGGNPITKTNNKVYSNSNFYYYPTYNNTAVILTDDGVKYKLSNINFNLYAKTFDFKISKDSIFVLSTKKINTLTINNNIFKSFTDLKEKSDKIYQVIYENENLALLRDDKIVYREVTDPMNQLSPEGFFSRVTNYYVRNKENSISKIKLKKKSILKLFENNGEVVKQYAKDNNFSYNDENDLKKIFEYYEELL